MSLLEQIDYYGKLSVQFPIPPLRVLYGRSGTLLAAVTTSDTTSVVDNTLYWASANSAHEAHYLCAIINSEIARERIAHLQSRGQWGTRDVHKLILTLPIPRFDSAQTLHMELAGAADQAEQVAAAVPLQENTYFVHARRLIRNALREDGVAARIDHLVAQLLG